MKRFVASLCLLVCLCNSAIAADYVFIFEAGRYYVIERDATGRPAKIREVVVQFITLDGVPVPNPLPDPNPKPVPVPVPVVVPEGVFGLTKSTFTAANKVMPATAKTKARELGDNYAAVSSQLAAGGYPDINSANAALKSLNQNTTGTTLRDAWLPFFTDRAAAMQQLFLDNKLKTLNDYADAYKAIADGLKLAASTP